MTINLNELDFENIGSWPRPIKLTIMSIAFFIVIMFGYMYDIKSQQETLSIANTEEIKLKNKFIKKQAMTGNVEAYIRQVQAIKEYFGELLRQLPGSTEIPGLVEDISHIGSANGLHITSIKLLKEETKDFYNEQPIEIVVQGAYHQLGKFVSDISSLSRIVTTDDFSIEEEDKKNNSGSALVMKMVAKTYRYVDENEQKSEKGKVDA